MPKVTETPPGLAACAFHGVEFAAVGGGQATGDCPFCGKAGKLRVNEVSGLWDCKSCGARGDVKGFLRQLWEASEARTTNADLDALARDRGLLRAETPSLWGAVRSVLGGAWLLPAFGPDGKMSQLYRWGRAVKGGEERRVLYPTPGLPAALFSAGGFDRAKPEVWVAEGPWDGMALSEAAGLAKPDGDGGLAATASASASLAASVNVLAIPGCGAAGKPLAKWASALAGNRVVFPFDSDHPKPLANGASASPGFEAAKRAAAAVAAAKPKEVLFLSWGPDGFDPSLPDGHDVRDALKAASTVPGRVAALAGLLAKLAPVPSSSTSATARASTDDPKRVSVRACDSWRDVERAWVKALSWREELSSVLAAMLSVCLSTEQQGDQLFLQVIGEAGSGKTRFCDALLTSKNCFALEHLTGFHSGWKDPSGEDYSLISRIDRKTLVTPEGDVLMSSPRFAEIMSQQRRIFDGASGASYKNRKEDLRYTGLRTPWIIAGTPALLAADQSRLGDRFLRIVIDPPDADEQAELLRRVGFAALRSVAVASNGLAESTLDEEMAAAFALTGGYVDSLRDRAEELLSSLRIDDEEGFVTECARLGEFVADFRARPESDMRKAAEDVSTKELPTRLTSQFVRLACCLAVVLGKPAPDEAAMRIVRKVALDTARGRTLEMAKALLRAGPGGASAGAVSVLVGLGEDAGRTLLNFLRRIGAVQTIAVSDGKLKSLPRWRLSDRTRALAERVLDA